MRDWAPCVIWALSPTAAVKLQAGLCRHSRRTCRLTALLVTAPWLLVAEQVYIPALPGRSRRSSSVSFMAVTPLEALVTWLPCRQVLHFTSLQCMQCNHHNFITLPLDVRASQICLYLQSFNEKLYYLLSSKAVTTLCHLTEMVSSVALETTRRLSTY